MKKKKAKPFFHPEHSFLNAKFYLKVTDNVKYIRIIFLNKHRFLLHLQHLGDQSTIEY